MPDRYIIDTHGPDAEGIRTALALADEIAESEDCEVLLVVPLKGTAASTVLNQVIPANQIKQLLKGQTLMLNGNVPLRLESNKTLGGQGFDGVLVSLHPSTDALAKVDQMVASKAVIVVPWVEAECTAWRAQWDPTVVPPNAKKE